MEERLKNGQKKGLNNSRHSFILYLVRICGLGIYDYLWLVSLLH